MLPFAADFRWLILPFHVLYSLETRDKTLNGRREDSNEQGGVNVGCGFVESAKFGAMRHRILSQFHSLEDVPGDALGAGIRAARRGINGWADVPRRFG